MRKELKIRAYYKSCDNESKKLTMLFLDDNIDPYTRSAITRLYYPAQCNPMNQAKTEFYVKFNSASRAYLDLMDASPTSIQSLVDQVVEIIVYIRHYNFVGANGKKIIGWNLNLIKINPAHYS